MTAQGTFHSTAQEQLHFVQSVERIHYTKDILIRNSNNPPSLLALARQVGLNDCTLKKGFRQVFGTSAFGYLHDYRMQQVQQLLLERKMKVEEVAHAVGYASRSSFIAAFNKKFGVSPSAYLVRKNSKKISTLIFEQKKIPSGRQNNSV
nr:AraC family transcriptional regulator [Chroococcidiopsis sp. CCMEE 29]